MSVADINVVDGIACDHDCKTLIMEIYDHLDFEDKLEYDHLVILQDKLNTYLWYIDKKQYLKVYQNSITHGLKRGETKTIKWPVPTGKVY